MGFSSKNALMNTGFVLYTYVVLDSGVIGGLMSLKIISFGSYSVLFCLKCI